MLRHEYQAQIDKQDKHAVWPVRLIFAIFALFFASGIGAVWEFLGHNGYIVVAVIIPLGALSAICILAAFSATRKSARDFIDAILSLLYFMP